MGARDIGFWHLLQIDAQETLVLRDQSLFFWGMVVTMFIMIAAVLTARELLDMYFEKRDADDSDESENTDSDNSTPA